MPDNEYEDPDYGDSPEERLEKLEQFFKDIARMTKNHDVINDSACVTADKLGEALEKVDPEWYNKK